MNVEIKEAHGIRLDHGSAVVLFRMSSSGICFLHQGAGFAYLFCLRPLRERVVRKQLLVFGTISFQVCCSPDEFRGDLLMCFTLLGNFDVETRRKRWAQYESRLPLTGYKKRYFRPSRRKPCTVLPVSLHMTYTVSSFSRNLSAVVSGVVCC